jgi:hypothetical protein
MATTPTTQADRVSRSLKRLGLRMTRVGRSFTVVDNAGGLAPASKTGMSLAEVEHWIGEHIKLRRSGRPLGPIEDNTMSATEGTLQLQRSGRWTIVRPGRIPVEITSGQVFRVEVDGEMKPTRMEFRHFVGPANVHRLYGQSGEYYSVDGYLLRNGMRAAISGTG